MTTRLSEGAGCGNVARPSTRTNFPSCAETMMSAADVLAAAHAKASDAINAFMDPPCRKRGPLARVVARRPATSGPLLGFVFERQLDARPIGDDFPAFDLHVELRHFGDP